METSFAMFIRADLFILSFSWWVEETKVRFLI